ncbi:hypothetical protein HWV62_42532 [Athelia sp. TMB]|nr:hypothetical protein HWV62_42532 [Athelia sp. TMB]
MSSRADIEPNVEKGGPIFRPVPKPRGRSTTANASRQSSVVGESRSSVAPIGWADASTSSNVSTDAVPSDMPPPTVVPSFGRDISPVAESNHARAPPSFATSQSTARIVPIPSAQSKTPSHAPLPHLSTSAIAPSTRSAPVLLTVGQTRSFPIHVEHPTTTQASTSSIVTMDLSTETTPGKVVDGVPMGPPHVQFEGFDNDAESIAGAARPDPEASAAVLITAALGTENTVKPPPKRKPGRKKKAETDDASVPSDKPKRTRKSSRPKASSTAITGTQDPVMANSGEVPDESEEPQTTKRKRRSSSVPRKPRKPRGPSQLVLDPEAGPGEELDPTTMTMADLCSDTGQGRISSKAVQIQSNHSAWKASNRERRTRMKLLMESKKYGKKDDAEEPETGPAQDSPTEIVATDNVAEILPVDSRAGSPVPSEGPVIEDETGQGFDYSEAMSTSRFNVQVRIGPNGETIIDEESLYVDRNDEAENLDYTHIEESDTTKFVNSATYGKKFRGSRWSAEETELFFDALSQFGENYELISFILPGRDRKACKNKFKAEDKRNSHRINFCLNNRIPYDINTLSRMTGKDFSGPTPEIRAPEVPSLSEPVDQPETSSSNRRVRKKSSTPRGHTDGVEVLGDLSMFDKDDDTE